MKLNTTFFSPQHLKQQINLSLLNAFSDSSSGKQHTSSPIKLDSFSLSPKNSMPPTYNNPYSPTSPAHVEELARLAKKNASNTFNLKAENNTLTFEQGCFYNIATNDGKNVTLFPFDQPSDGAIGIADSSTGNYSHSELKELSRIERFFSLLSSKSMYGLRTEYSPSEIRDTLGSLGIEPGKVQINTNGHKNTFYMLEDGTIYPEYQANAEKHALTTTNWFNYGCTTDSLFIIDGKEYHPNEQGYISLPKDAVAVSETITYPPLKVE